MNRRSTALLACLLVAGRPGAAQESGREATRSLLTIFDLDGKARRVVLDSPRRFQAPEWSPDGSSLILNSGGRLWRVAADGGGPPSPISAGSAGPVDINHGISPDGRTIAATFGAAGLATIPVAGGEPRRVAAPSPGYFQGWSPDGKTIAYTGIRNGGVDLFAVAAEGGAERRLTSDRGHDDYAAYSPDGRWIYFNSDRSGSSDIWRMPAEGAGAKDARAERITDDGPEDWSPHPSPDGRSLIFVSYPKGTAWHPADRDVAIRRLILPTGPGPGKPEELVRFVGGHGSVGSRPWSPDGRRFAYVAFEPPPPTIRVVFFTPADIPVPAGVADRLGQVVEAAERFLVEGMKQAGYPPAVLRPFRRNPGGSAEILQVKGDKPSGGGAYDRPNYAAEVIRRATQQYRVAGEGHLWWIFIDLGDRPRRFGDWKGSGHSRDGGWAMVNYDTIPGAIRPDLGLAAGFNGEFALKGTIHELGHAFGLPHIGPDPGLGLGNTLMGPNNSVYAGRGLPNADRVYLGDASAAILGNHPIFSGESKARAAQPAVDLVEFRRSYDKPADRITLAGRIRSDLPARSVVVLDDLGHPDDDYWQRGAAGRVEPDGTFRVAIDRPARVAGRHRVFFCFENGMVVGDPARIVADDRGEIIKAYRYRDGRYQFAD